MHKIYISSPIGKYQRKWNNKVAKILRKKELIVFLPQEVIDTSVLHAELQISAFLKCCEMIIQSDFGLLLPPYGRDSAWEVGYYKGINKPLYAYIHTLDKKKERFFKDWMIKGSINGIITSSKKTYKLLHEDPILTKKSIHYIENITGLPDILGTIHTISHSQ